MLVLFSLFGSHVRTGFPRCLPAAFVALFLMAPAVGGAQPEIRIEPETLYFGAAVPPAGVAGNAPAAPVLPPRQEVPQELLERAARPGGVRVLARLAVPFTPEGRLAGIQQVRSQRETLARLQETVLRSLAGEDFRLHARFRFIPFLALEVDAAALDRLAGLPEVVAVEEDVFERPSLSSSTAVIGAGVAWAGGLTGAGQTIAILDTGVDKTHPYFSSGPQNKVVSEACYSSTTSSSISLCPGGVAEATGPGTGAQCTGSYDCDHGTHVAGIAAGNDGVGPNFGVARDANVIAIQVFSAGCSYCGVGAWISDQIKGLERVYELADQFDIAAVNMSLGGGPYSSRSSCDANNVARKAAIDNLRSIDIATVASAGNDYSYGVSAPACISSAIGVGATDDGDVVADFSNVAPFLDLMAPGVGVDSSVPGGGTDNFDGTSMAAPHVAGAWAVLRQAYAQATVSDVLAILRATAVQVGGFGYDLRRINLGKAVTAGPLVTEELTIHNDGNAVLPVLGLQLETPAPWIRWTPEAPFDVPPGGSRQVSVVVDFGGAPSGTAMNRLIVSSTDSDESPYPDAVHLVIGKEACHPLTRTHAGSGGHPAAAPSSSPGCPPGQYHAGQFIALEGRPATGWAVQSWSGTDNDAAVSMSNAVTMPAAPHAVSVVYYPLCYALTLTHTGPGADPVASPASSPGCPAGQYRYAETIQLTAAPDRGRRVGGWTGTVKDNSRSVTNSVVMPASPRTVSVSYQSLPSLLLVDDYNGYERSVYTAALDALGLVYDVWYTDIYADGPVDAATLAAYPGVVWIPSYYGTTLEADTALTTYLNQGGGLFIASGDYFYYRGLTPFAVSYLGVADYESYAEYSSVTGQGQAFSGLGPYGISSYFNSEIVPGPEAETAFTYAPSYYYTGSGSAGVSKVGPNYRTILLGFELSSLPAPETRRDVLGAAVDFLGTVFADVGRGHWAKKWIEAMYRNGVTSGCGSNPRTYCPTNLVTRDQISVFLLLAKEGPAYAPPPCTTAPFNDVPVSSPFCPWMQELAKRGITGGCGGGSFCPQTVVTRDQAAVFLLSALEGPGYAPPACTVAAFNDVPVSSPFCPWVQELAKRGITGGCGGGSFCPCEPDRPGSDGGVPGHQLRSTHILSPRRGGSRERLPGPPRAAPPPRRR